jgi:broad specificity phosphatase PhoE
MGRIYLVRHGQASLLADDYDVLSPLGELQGRTVGRWFSERIGAPKQVVSGSLRRQSRTATECIAGAGWNAVVPSVDKGFDEYSQNDLIASAYPQLAEPAVLGAYLRASANPRAEFQSMFERAFRQWTAGERTVAGDLTWAAFKQRGVEALMRVVEQCGSGESAVIVSSGGPITAICQTLLGFPDEKAFGFHTVLFNASITHLLTNGSAVSLSTFNSIAHLEPRHGDDSLVSYR